MTDQKNRQWILSARPAGKLTGNEFRWNEAPIPRPSDGQVLIRTLWLSIDPTQRIWMARDSYKPAVPLGDVMQSFRCRAGDRIASSRLQAGRPRAGRFQLAGLRRDRWQRLRRDAQDHSRHAAQPCVEPVRASTG